MTTNSKLQGLLETLARYQSVKANELAGKSADIRGLAKTIASMYPGLDDSDKLEVLAAVNKGPGSIYEDIWKLFEAIVGVKAPAKEDRFNILLQRLAEQDAKLDKILALLEAKPKKGKRSEPVLF